MSEMEEKMEKRKLFWARYIDDTLAMVKRQNVNLTLTSFNNFCKKIVFIIEMGMN